jgi:hypothetical protein
MKRPESRPAAPCADCRTTGGHVYDGMRKPGRMSGRRFGIDGPLCVACYYKWRYRRVICPRAMRPSGANP